MNTHEVEMAYEEVTRGVMEPDAMFCPASVARSFGIDVPLEIGDDVPLIVTSAGWEVMQ